MLRELFVQNLALIEDVRVELEAGFCAWTGETGAGKSLLLGAVGLLLGDRGSADLIRLGSEELRVTGRFQAPPTVRPAIEEILEHPLDDDQILLSRRLHRAGRSQAYVNDEPVAVATLREIGELLVDVHGQRESESLLQPAYQLLLLDAYGKLGKYRENYVSAAGEVRALRQQYQRLSAERQQRQRELSLARFESDELDQAALKPGELNELQAERERLAHAQGLQEFAARSVAALYEDDGAIVELAGRLHRDAESWVRIDPALEDIVRRLESLATEVQDLAQTLRDLESRWEADPARLDEVERRLQLLRRLEKKYGKSVEDLIAYRLMLDDRALTLQSQEDDLERIHADLAVAFGRLRETAEDLSERRKKVAKKLAAEVQKELAGLGMPEAKLEAVLDAQPFGDDPAAGDVPTWGVDQLELYLAANPGEPALPLRKVASGGELSRAMLALKTVLAAHDQRTTLVFDEIDANVGGRFGDVLGRKLAALGRTHQVICVTHLPQVASYARHHWTIRKRKRGNRTTTSIEPLNDEARLEELASMLRGESRGETTRQEAAAMLEAAARHR